MCNGLSQKLPGSSGPFGGGSNRTVPGHFCTSHSTSSKTPSHFVFLFSLAGKAAATLALSQGTCEVRFPIDVAGKGTRPQPRLPREEELWSEHTARPASPEQEPCFCFEALWDCRGQCSRTWGDSWYGPETSISAHRRVRTRWDLQLGAVEEEAAGSGMGRGPCYAPERDSSGSDS